MAFLVGRFSGSEGVGKGVEGPGVDVDEGAPASLLIAALFLFARFASLASSAFRSASEIFRKYSANRFGAITSPLLLSKLA